MYNPHKAMSTGLCVSVCVCICLMLNHRSSGHQPCVPCGLFRQRIAHFFPHSSAAVFSTGISPRLQCAGCEIKPRLARSQSRANRSLQSPEGTRCRGRVRHCQPQPLLKNAPPNYIWRVAFPWKPHHRRSAAPAR